MTYRLKFQLYCRAGAIALNNDEILKEWTDSKTGFIVKRERVYDDSILPLWQRVWSALRDWRINGLRVTT